ncbi:SIMPL domain-containing protein [Natrinema salsiterrestre]|uniref:SIMPL domain-containing protein n=1 Tax=Natrinema salsiterrestre TaxID=2950540 RepID=A0A9Q4Q2F1_9EURY|nr:SIMPL domain-containing protein [Natrinema salsiterrestre]MDF9744812.1 SIMPL domain-containing protein [Natrinema salsiterrestre]
MDRRQFLAASTVGLATAVAGCAASPLSTDDGDSNPDGSESAGRGEITVSAGGEVEAEPDRAIVSVGVEASGGSAEAVTDELATGAERLRAAFDDLEIPEENVEEGQYRISPVRRRDGGTDGFEGTHSFEVTLTDVDRVGEVVDAAVAAGADDMGYVNFTLQEETRAELRKDAIDAALDNADAEAAHIADNRGVSLEGTTAVTSGDVQVHPVRREAMASGDAAGGAPPTEIDAEPVTVSASVTVTYAFAG